MKKNLPVILLRGIVLVPNNEIRLEFDNQESKSVIDMAEYFHDNYIFIINEITNEQTQKIGIISKIEKKFLEANGNYRVVIKGLYRGRIIEYINSDTPESVEVIVEKVVENGVNEEAEMIKKLYRIIEGYIRGNPYIDQKVLGFFREMKSLSEMIDASLPFIPITPERALEYVYQLDVKTRMDMLCGDIEQEAVKTNVDGMIDSKVRVELDKNQHEFILREKMKAIKEELGEAGSKDDEISELREKILNLAAPTRIKERLQTELKRYDMLPPTSPEVHIAANYIDWLLNIPWQKMTKDNENLKDVEQKLDNSHFGLETVKMRILEFLAVKQRTNSLNGPILCLVGPPGVGKTSLAVSIADAMKRQFVKMSVGGIHDEAELIGHRKAYIGSSPGRIIQGLKKAKTANPLFLIDEIDKMTKDIKGDPASVLLEVLDPEQNKFFSDNYIEEAVDLSNVLFIATANYAEDIPDALRDRLEIINLSGYTEYEKLYIAKNHLLTKICQNHGIELKKVTISDNIILEVIRNYTKEAGVRELERQLSKIVRKVVYDIVINKKEKNYTITKPVLHKYLGTERYFTDKKEFKKEIGVVNGLVYTYFGGDTIPIEVNLYKGKGDLILTGSLGDVMKESAQIALGYIKSNHQLYNIAYELITKNNIHIHVPEGAVKKDGPSAGIALTTAMISVLGKYEIPHDVAMTGEITLRGRVLSIGGLKEKSIGALRNGIKKIIIPEGNMKDISEIPKEINSKITYIPVKNYSEVFNYFMQ